MISGQLLKFAEKYDWKKHESENEILLFGSFNGFLFTAMEGNGFKAFFTSIAGISRDNLDNLRQWLETNKKTFRFRNFDMTDNFLCVRLQESWLPRSVSSLETFLIRLSGKLDELELPDNACAICGHTAEKKGLYVGFLCYLHPECQQSTGVDFTDVTEKTYIEAASAPLSQSKINDLAESMKIYDRDIVRDITRLVNIPSFKDNPAENAPYGENTARVLNEFLTMAADLGFNSVNLENRVGYVEWGKGEKLIAALCHLDVVPEGSGWNYQPFSATEVDGRLFGRGTLDDKGPAVAVLYAMKALSDEGYQPAARIRLIVGLDEEQGSDCMEWYKKTQELPVAGFTADASFPVIHAEKGIIWAEIKMNYTQSADDNLRLVSATGGSAANMVPGSCRLVFDGMEPIIIEGKQAHASRPLDGENAISLAMQQAADLLRNAESTHKFVDLYMDIIGSTTNGSLAGLDFHDESGALTLNSSILELDSQSANLTIDIRYPVTIPYDKIQTLLTKLVTSSGGECFWLKHQKPLYMDKDSELVESLNKVYQVMTDTTTTPAAIGGGTYARSIPGIVAFGPAFPGDNDMCHQADEYIDEQKLLAAAAIYREALRALSR